MDAESTIKSVLDGLGVPVARMVYDGKADTFITYQCVISSDTAFADDASGAEEFLFRIDIYSRKDYIALLRRAKRALRAAGFYGVSVEAELFENDTKFFHVPLNARYMEEL